MRLKPINTTLAISTIAIILGIIFQNNLGFSVQQTLLILLLGVSVGVFFFFRMKKAVFVGVFLIFFVGGMLLYSVHYEPNTKNHYTQKLKENQFYTLEGKILSVKGKNAIVRLQKFKNQEITGKILLSFTDSLSAEVVGNSILFHTELKPISAVKNPYQFDYQRYMSCQNIFWRGFVSNYQLQQSDVFSLTIFAARLQHRLASSLDNYSFSAESKGIIKALLLGVRHDIQEETYQEYIDAGAVHILAISGLHIGIITMILSYILHFFFRRKKYKVLIMLLLMIFLWAYALLTGLSASVVRAVMMFSFLSMALELKKYQGAYDNLIVSIFILLIFNPLFLFDVGFQLSYLAVFSIVTFLPIFNSFWFPKNKIIRFFYGILAVSFSAQIGVLPVSLYYFHQFPTLFFVTNILILPFLGIILGVGILVIGLAGLGILPNFLVVGYDFSIRLMNTAIGWVASFNDLIFKQIYFDWRMLLCSFLGIILLAFWLHFKNIRFLYAMFASVIMYQFILFYDKYTTQTTSEVIVFQKYNSSVIGIRNGEKLHIFSSQEEKAQKNIANFVTQFRIKQTHFQQIPNIFSFNGKTILVLDDIWYPDVSFPEIDYLILINSPKIHLEKLLQVIKPQLLIADGSNAFWFVKQWKETCQKQNIPFHSTNEKGYISIKN